MNPSFQLIDTGWDKVIHEAATADRTELRVVCPFIKVRAAKRLLSGKCPGLIQVITRFNLAEMCDGVNDTAALRLLLENGARIRGITNLHSKLYIFGDHRAIVTSANLTEAALLRNHEFGFVSNESSIIARCRDYFDTLWRKAGPDLDLARLAGWERSIERVRVSGARPSAQWGLSDEGTDAGIVTQQLISTPRIDEAPQSFVKFFGEGHNRARLDMSVLQEVERSGSHWACTYPKTKRPRQVKDGAVMFMGRLVDHPKDIIIYGRAIALAHVPGRDEATADEIAYKERDWKALWPMYIRVHHAEFVAGTLANGIRLSHLMDSLKSDSFLPTQRNARNGAGNTDPRSAYRQQPAVQLTDEAFAWLNHRLELAFTRHGKLTPTELVNLDWPAIQPQIAPAPSHLNEFQKWITTAEANAEATSKGYARFLTRCTENYAEVLNEKTARTDADVERIIKRVSAVVSQRGRWTDTAFNENDVPDNFIPALRAYSRFIRERFPSQGPASA